MGCRRCLPLAFVVIALLLPSAAPAEDYKDLYGKAISKIDKSKWSEAEQLLRQAIAANPSADKKKMRIYGSRLKPYLPYYQLGLALYKQGDCRGALDAWQTAEQQGAVQSSSSEYKDLSKWRDECRQSLPPPTATKAPTPRPTATPRATATPRPTATPKIDHEKIRRLQEAIKSAEQKISRAETAGGEVSRRRSDAAFGDVWKQNSDLDARKREADDALKQARKLLGTGKSQENLVQLESAARLADQATRAFETVAGAADSKLAELTASEAEKQAMEAARRKIVKQIADRLPAARDALKQDRGLSADGRRALGSDRAALEQLVRDGEGASRSSLSVAQLEALYKSLGSAPQRYRRAVTARAEEERRQAETPPTPVPTVATPVEPVEPADPIDLLRSAAGALLAADYGRAVGELETFELTEGRPAAVAYMVRAAARFYLFVEGGGQDASLVEAATADVALCRAADDSIAPEQDFFSPAFVEFFSEAG